MLNIFKIKNNNIIKIKFNENKTEKNYIWIDIINPNKNEKKYIQNILNFKLIKEKFNIESSARFYKYQKKIHIHSFFIYKDSNNYIQNSNVIFIIKKKKLYSIRDAKLSCFRLYKIQSRKKIFIDINSYKLLLDLFEIKIEQLADEIEKICNNLENLTQIILINKSSQDFDESISILSKEENTTSKIRLCLIDTQRALNFLIRKIKLKKYLYEQAKELLRDIESILPHNESIFQKINFLMQSAMGFLNIEQNKIIKIFSIISVVFLPPTLLTSTYGMNFKFIPELKWRYGYPITIIMMFIFSLSSYTYFKFKKWL